jgi:uncharacterized RDD family membrane protein YckC
MDAPTEKSDKPVIPPPDLPKPSIAPPAEAPRQTPPVSSGTGDGQPPVNVKIRPTEAADEASRVAGGHVPFNTRLAAGVIDVVVASGLQLAAVWILPHFAEGIAWLVGAGYLVARDSLPFLKGQSVGKMAMKLKAVGEDGQPLTGHWEAALLRNAPLIIPFFALIEIFVLLSREEKPGQGRRLGDEWARTKVIFAPDPEREETGE